MAGIWLVTNHSACYEWRVLCSRVASFCRVRSRFQNTRLQKGRRCFDHCGGAASVPFFVDAMRPKSGTTSEMQDDGSGGKAHKRQGPIRRTGSLADRSKREPHRVRLAYESIFNRPPTETEIQAVPVFVKTKPTPQACWSAPWQSLWAGHEFLAGSLYENENSLFPPITLCVPSCGSRNGPAARCRL